MIPLDCLKQGIAELVEKIDDEDLLDFVYRLLIAEG
jgi:hypothetical protein